MVNRPCLQELDQEAGQALADSLVKLFLRAVQVFKSTLKSIRLRG